MCWVKSLVLFFFFNFSVTQANIVSHTTDKNKAESQQSMDDNGNILRNNILINVKHKVECHFFQIFK